MLADIKNTISQSAIYGLSRVSAKLIAFILLPLLTLNLSVAEYGVYVLTESFWQILWAVFLFGLESGIVRWYLEIKDEYRKKKFLFTVSIFVLVLNVFFLAVIFIFSFPISQIVFENGALNRFVIYASLIAFAETISFIIFLVLRIEEKAKLYSFFSILTALISLVLQVYFLQYTLIKLEGVFISKIIAPGIIVLLLLPYYIKHLKAGFEKDYLAGLVKYSFPIMIASFVLTLLNQVDRYILGYFTGLHDVGIFGLANNISGLINFLVISPFSLAFTVLSWKKLNDDNAKRFFTKTTTYLFLAVIFISLIVSLFTPHFIKIFTLKTDYWVAADYVPWVILSMPFYGIHFIGVFSFYVTKKTKYVFYSYLIALITKVGLDIFLIPAAGIYGASFVNFFSFAVLSIALYYFSKTNYFFEYEWKKLILMIFFYTLLVFPFFYFDFNSRLLEIVLKIAAVFLFPILLLITRSFEQVEINAVKGFINKYFIKFIFNEKK